MLNPGSVTETFGIAGVREYTHGFKTIAEAIYLRERILRQRQLAAQTAHHVQRQGVTAARNVAALSNRETPRIQAQGSGFTVDITGRNAIATPFGVMLNGLLARLVGRAYHLMALPLGRLRVLSN